MTTSLTAPTQDSTGLSCDFLVYQARDRQRVEARMASIPDNKAAIFAALRQSDISAVDVSFDGCGDSGQIESMQATLDDGSETDTLPEINVALVAIDHDSIEAEPVESSLADAIEALAYDLLNDAHGGWEINEGAYGSFTFDAAGDQIVLDYNERVESSEYSQHIW